MGSVKTRLAREVGQSVATSFYRHAARSTIMRLARTRRWQVVLAVAPDTALHTRAWPSPAARMAQGNGDLGARMRGLAEEAPAGPVLIMGTDIPGVTPEDIAHAFWLLGRHDAVVGPADDGGYWLIGFRRTRRWPKPFSGIRWSTAHTLEDTLARLAGWRVGKATRRHDVDNALEVRRCRSWSGRLIRPPLPIDEK